MADKKISEFGTFPGEQDSQTYYVVASGDPSSAQAANYKVPFTDLALSITGDLNLGGGSIGSTDPANNTSTVNFNQGENVRMYIDESGGVNVSEKLIVSDGKETVLGGNTTIKETLTVADGKQTVLGGVTTIKGATTINETLTVSDGKETILGGNTTIKETLTVADGKQTTLGGPVTIKGDSTFEQSAIFTDLTSDPAPPDGKLYRKGNDLYFGGQKILTEGQGGVWEDGTTAGQIYYSGGNVGIGTDSPGSKLEIIDNQNHLNLKVSDTISQSVLRFSDSDGLGGAINYDHNTDKLHFIMDGTATPSNGALSIDSTSNVGIGTASPQTNLHVSASGAEGSYITIGAAGTGDAGLYIDASAGDLTGSDYISLRQIDDLSLLLSNHGANPMHFCIGGDSVAQSKITIRQDGNVGIGTNSPDYLLDLHTTTNPATLGLKGYGAFVDGSVASQIGFLGKDSNGGNRDLAWIKVMEHDHALGSGSIEFETRISGNNATRMAIAESGNVGIGTATPGASLDIVNTSSTTSTSYGLSVQGGGNSNASGYSLRALDMDGNTDLFVRGDGFVGIGTDDPKANLHLLSAGAGTASGDLRLETADHNGNAGICFMTADQHRFSLTTLGTNGGTLRVCNNALSDVLTISEDGHVRIIGTGNESDVEDAAAGASLGIQNKSSAPNGTFTSLNFFGPDRVSASVRSQVVNHSTNEGNLTFNTVASDGSSGSHIERMRIDSNGNVGIGTATPHTALHVGDDAPWSVSDPEARISVYNTDGYSGYSFGEDANTRAGLVWDATNKYAYIFTYNNGTPYEENLVLKDGNVGIGTASPVVKLDIEGSGQAFRGYRKTTTSTHDLFTLNSDVDGTNTNVFKIEADGTVLTEGNVGIGTATPTHVLEVSQPGDVSTTGSGAMRIYAGLNGSGKGLVIDATSRMQSENETSILETISRDGSTTGLKVQVDGNSVMGETLSIGSFTSSSHGETLTGDTIPHRPTLRLETKSGTSLSMSKLNDLPYMHFKGQGAKNWFTHLHDPASDPTFAISTNDNSWAQSSESRKFLISYSGAVTIPGLSPGGSVQANGSGALTASSDKRLKNDLGDSTYGLNEILQIVPKKFTWKDDESETPNIGFFAQDIVEVIPEAAPSKAITNEDGEEDIQWGFSDRPIIAALVNSIKELKAENDSLKSRIEALES